MCFYQRVQCRRNLARARSGLSAARSGFRFGLFVFFLSLLGFLFRCCPHCLSEPHRASTCSVLLPLAFGLPSRFRTFGKLRAFAVGRVFFVVCLCVAVPRPFSRWYIARLALDCFALVSTSDAAPSSCVSRLQPSGGSRLLFASSRVNVCSDLLLSDSQCTGLIGFCRAS